MHVVMAASFDLLLVKQKSDSVLFLMMDEAICAEIILHRESYKKKGDGWYMKGVEETV